MLHALSHLQITLRALTFPEYELSAKVLIQIMPDNTLSHVGPMSIFEHMNYKSV